MRLEVEAPADFSFRRTILSHGWAMLPPFELGPRGSFLATTVSIDGHGAFRFSLAEAPGGVALEVAGRPPAAVRRALVAAARKVLGLDLDLGPFHEAVRGDARLGWIAATRTGRLLRAPSLFEDVVKLVLTTNCSWAFTTKMAAALVERYGEPSPGGTKAFPTPERLGRVPESELRGAIRAGYRAPYLAALARRVAGGEADPESWISDPRDPEALRRAMLDLPGVGPYVAENLLRFLGRPHGLALDSWMRAKFSRMYHGGRPVTDRTIRRAYARCGAWAGLAVWFDLTKDWFDGDEPSAAWDSLT